jgi:uncharacterized membrane protein
MYWSGHMTTGGWILSILWTAIVIALVVALIVWLASSARPSDARSDDQGSARDILDRRLASGELTLEQHERLRSALSDHSGPEGGSAPRPAGAPG